LGINVAHDLRLLGPLDAAVYLAYYMTPFFILFAIEFIKTKQKSQLIFAITLALLILATKSMGAIGGSFLIILIYLIKNGRLLKTKRSKILTTLAILAVVGVIFYTKVLPTIQTKWSSLNERGEIWATSMELLKNPKTALLGVGLGQFEYQYIENVNAVLGRQPLDYYVIQPHNIFLLFIFHYGILGFLLTCYLIYKTAKISLEPEKSPRPSRFQQEMAFIFLYFLTHGLIDTPFFKNDMLILLFIFMESAIYKKKDGARERL
jgi:O-antigen ligase